MIKICVYCAKEYDAGKYSNNLRKFCSNVCKYKAAPKKRKKKSSEKTFSCHHCGREYIPLLERESFTKHCSITCHNMAVSKSRTKPETIEKREKLLLDPEDEHLRSKVVFNSVSRPYIPLPKGGKKSMTGLARFLLDAPEGLEVDHINRDFMDNRKSNLRICTRKLNMTNKGETQKRNKNNIGLPTGVSRIKDRFYARISSKTEGKLQQTSLGAFPTREEASKAYQEALRVKIEKLLDVDSSGES